MGTDRISNQPPPERSQRGALPAGPEISRRGEGRHEAGSVLSAGRALLDRYTPKILNEVIRNLKMMLSQRAGLAREVAAKLEKKEGMEKGEKADKSGEIKKSVLDPQAMKEEMAKKGIEGDGKKPLTEFEKVFLAHIDGGLALGEEPLPEGKYKYAMKTEQEQENFFLKTSPMAVAKKTTFAEIKEAIFRGLFNLKGHDGKKLMQGESKASSQLLQLQAKKAAEGTLVSDLKLANGKTEKFARMQVKGEPLQKVAELVPGDLIQTALLKAAVGDDVMFQALSYKIVHPELLKPVAKELGMDAGQLARDLGQETVEGTKDRGETREGGRGGILSVRAEQMAAEALDVRWRSEGITSRDPAFQDPRAPQRGEASSPGVLGGLLGLFRKKRKGFLGYDAELVPGFVPWYQLVWQKRDWKQKPKWFVMLTYFAFFSTLALFAYFVFRFLLQE